MSSLFISYTEQFKGGNVILLMDTVDKLRIVTVLVIFKVMYFQSPHYVWARPK